jgi:hypothetical protein
MVASGFGLLKRQFTTVPLDRGRPLRGRSVSGCAVRPACLCETKCLGCRHALYKGRGQAKIARLGQYHNKTILVSIPSLFDDDKPRLYKLVNIEPFGLWLESPELATRLVRPKEQHAPETLAAFFPFARIAYVLDTQLPASAQNQAPPSDSQKPQPDPHREKKRP